jgi:aminobenzoyl-glutamate utilization protein B
MRAPTRFATLTLVLALAALPAAAPQKPAAARRPDPADARLQALKQQAIAEVDAMATLTQQMIDQVFSYGELGFQEVETSRYLTGVLRKNGFTVTEGMAGIPTAWVASWGSGKPVIALGSDIDGLPQTRSPASRGTSRWWTARPGTARATTPACR